MDISGNIQKKKSLQDKYLNGLQNLLHQITRNRFIIKDTSESLSLNTTLIFALFLRISISKEFSKCLFQYPVSSLSIHSSFHFSLDFLFSNKRPLAKYIVSYYDTKDPLAAHSWAHISPELLRNLIPQVAASNFATALVSCRLIPHCLDTAG